MAEDVIYRMLGKHLVLSRAPIEAGTYAEDAPALPTVGVGAQWIVAADTPEDRVYDICRALWNPATRVLLDGGHPTGNQIQLETALDGVDIPLHPGDRKSTRLTSRH